MNRVLIDHSKELLKDKVFISTRPYGKSDILMKRFEQAGAKLYELPMIEIMHSGLEEDLAGIFRDLFSFDWIIFTSANAVEHFMYELKKRKSTHELSGDIEIKMAVIGQKTAEMLKTYGYFPDFMAQEANGEAFAEDLKQLFLNNYPTVLWPTGNLASDYLPKKLSAVADVVRINLYETTVPKKVDHTLMKMIARDQYDLIFFYSPSAVNNFYEICQDKTKMKSIKAACIGKVTEEACLDKEIFPVFIPERPDSESLFEATTQYFQSMQNNAE